MKKIEETNKENKSLKEKIDSHNKALEKKSKSLSKRKVELKNQLDEKKIDELESKVISLTNDLNSKEVIVQEQKDKIDEKAKNNKISLTSDSSENAGLIQKLEQRKKIL